MATLVGSLLVSLGLDSATFKSGLSDAEKKLKQAQKSFEKTGKSLQDMGTKLTIGVTAPLVAFGVASIKAASESRDAMAQVEASLKSMGNAAGFTKDQLADLASGEMQKSLYDDDEILRKVTANLLTFGNIAGDEFKRAQAAAVDLSAKLGTDLQSATILVGKALNDPVKGMTALSKAGIQLTDSQKAAVKSMAAVGDQAGAQKILLRELETQFAGSAEAARKADPAGAMKQSWAELQETVGAQLLPIFEKIAEVLGRLADKFNNVSPGMQSFIVSAGLIAAVLGPLLIAFGALIQVAAPMLALFTSIGGLMASTGTAAGAASVGFASLQPVFAAVLAAISPLLAPLAAVAAAGALLYTQWDKIAPVLQKIGERFQEAIGPRIIALVEGISAKLSELWSGPLGQGIRVVVGLLGDLVAILLEAFGETLVRVLGTAIDVFSGAMDVIIGAINVVVGVLTGDWRMAWEGAKSIFSGVVNAIISVAELLAPGISAAMSAMYSGVKLWIQDKLGAVFNWLKGKIEAVTSWFYGMYDAVVGHSYVPDMMDGIEAEFQRLQKAMVEPAKKATAAVKAEFKRQQEAAQDFAELLNRLFPEKAATREFRTNLPKIFGSKLSNADKEMAAKRLGDMFTGEAPEVTGDSGIVTGLKELGKELPKFAGGIETVNARIVKSFKDMADDTLSSISNLANSIKSGGIVDILSGVLDLFMQLGSIGAFGKGIQTTLNNVDGAKAEGGQIWAGRTYLTGELGPEVVTAKRNGWVTANDNLNDGRGGSSTVHIIPSPYFDAVVDQRASGVAAPMAARAAMGGAQIAQQNIGKRQRNRIPQ